MTTFSLKNIRYELCFAIRNGDVLTTAERGVTTASQTFTATAGQVNFSLTHGGVKNIRSLTVNGAGKNWLADYTANFNTGVITLLVAATLSDSVVVSYDYGTGDKIYPDLPRVQTVLNSCPRIGIETTSITSNPIGLGGMDHISEFIITVFIWVSANKDTSISSYGGTDDLMVMLSKIRDIIRQNAKLFYSFPYITPKGTNPMLYEREQKIIQGSQDYNIKFVVETG